MNGDRVKNYQEKVIANLKKTNLSITKARKSILELLITHRVPLSAQEIYDHLTASHFDMATIYRCLKKFVEKDLVQRCDFGDNIARYETKDDQHHHHILCRACNKIEVVEYCFLSEMEKMLRHRGYKEVSHSLEFFGICQDCQKD